jgi:hypothetical protein
LTAHNFVLLRSDRDLLMNSTVSYNHDDDGIFLD